MTDSYLLKYAAQFRSLRTNFTHEYNQSPHKFVLLLSVVRLYDSGCLNADKIIFTDELLNKWQGIFRQEWINWVRNPHHQMNFAMPLYHLRNESFWQFVLKEGRETVLGKSLKKLRDSVDCILIDTELVALLRQPETRALLKDVLLARLYEIA